MLQHLRTSVNCSDFVILQGFYFRKVSRISSRDFPNIQYSINWVLLEKSHRGNSKGRHKKCFEFRKNRMFTLLILNRFHAISDSCHLLFCLCTLMTCIANKMYPDQAAPKGPV